MQSIRATARAGRTVHAHARLLRQQSTQASSGNSGLPQSVAGGLIGGSAVFLIGYGYYHFSGTKTFVNTARETHASFQKYKDQLKQSTPESGEALEWLRQTANSYAAVIPGGKSYVDNVFNDIDAIQQKHGEEVDQIVQEAYEEFKGISNEGLSFETAQKAWGIIEKHMKRLGHLTGDSAQEIINNHPMLKEKFGGSLDQLKQMGEDYGPEAKKQVDETWDQIRDVMKEGFSLSSVPKIQSLVQDKIKKMQELGNKAWEKGMEQAKPYLDKSPKVKELVEKNVKDLKQGNVNELYEKIKEAVQSGNTGNLENYIRGTAEKAKQGGGGGGFEQYMNIIPGGSDVLSKFSQLQEIAQEHGEEAEKIAKSTVEEIQQILQKKVGEAQELARKSRKKST